MPMSDASSPTPPNSNAVTLVRTSQGWSQADSAAGFVLRYLAPMRRQLAVLLKSTEQADEGLKMIIAHLVSAGFGDHKHDRLRDFLFRSIRSAARKRLNEIPENKRPDIDFDRLQSDSRDWLRYWREGLLERAWRALERIEHATPSRPLYSVLHCATTNPQATPSMLTIQIATETGVQIDELNAEATLSDARRMFAQLVADEISETLENPVPADVKQEIKSLGLGKAFAGIMAKQ